MEKQIISIAVSVVADPKKTWDYFTLPEHITKWNFASEDWHCPKASNDLRVGGKYFGRMEAKNGSFGFDFLAIYDEIIDQKKIAYTMEDGRKAIINFLPKEAETIVTIDFEAEEENAILLQEAGWQAILNNFKKHTETE